LFVAVLPALETPVAPDPLFVIAGGPGQAATSMAEFASRAFSGVRRYRDIVLVDLAGTGRSAALQCQMYPTARDLVGDFYPISQVRACRDSLSQRTDLRRYNTSTLMDDLDEVRAVLGYDAINLYGTSYGTRATHVVIPNLSHGFSSISECGANFIAAFISAASPRGVDFSCKDRVRLPRFALGAQ
jgi:pimeloyl-ACP methyl ester carboxylesterase